MIEAIDHVNIVVRDLDAMTAFYRDVLGLSVTKHVNISGAWIDQVVGLHGVQAEVVYLDAPSGPRIELLKYHAPAGAAPAEGGVSNTQGLRHMAFRVADLRKAVARLESAGVAFFSGVETVPQSQVTYQGDVRKSLVYFHDPEKNILELCEYRTP